MTAGFEISCMDGSGIEIETKAMDEIKGMAEQWHAIPLLTQVMERR